MVFPFQIKSHRIIFQHTKYTINQYVEKLKCGNNGEYEYVIRKKRKIRSDNQRKYWFGIICKILGEYCGYTKAEMHGALKGMFLMIPGKKGLPDRIGSTRDLDTKQQEELNDRVRQWAAEKHNIQIPLPNEVDFESLSEIL